MLLNNQDLWIKCSEWGSFISSGDPGACMYGFNEDSSFQDRTHAETVLEHVKNDCMAIAISADDIEDLENIMETAEAYLANHPTINPLLFTAFR